MRINKAIILEIFFLVFLTGCLDGALNSTPYDGSWMVSYTEPDPSMTGVGFVVCTNPVVPLTLVNGSGSATQVRTCDFTNTTTTPATTYTKTNNYVMFFLVH